MAKRRRKKIKRSGLPPWLWMFFGLAIGLSVALAIYVNGHSTKKAVPQPVKEPASMSAAAATSMDRNGEVAATEKKEPRFTFYSMLPTFEVVIPEQEPEVSADRSSQTIIEPGIYVLQAGSFTKFADADRRRAQLAMQGIESRIQRVSIDDKTYHRVRIGPIDDLDELNIVRARLRAAKIDVLRIRLGD